jgi:hypothetical protein
MLNAILSIDTRNVKEALDLTWKGMLSIFLGIAIIFVAIILLSKIKDKKK